MSGVNLGLAGKTMCAIGFDDSGCLYFSDGHVLGLEAPFAIGTADDTVDLADAAEAASSFAFVDVAIGAAVTAASADEDGTLRLHFSDGCVLNAVLDAGSVPSVRPVQSCAPACT